MKFYEALSMVETKDWEVRKQLEDDTYADYVRMFKKDGRIIIEYHTPALFNKRNMIYVRYSASDIINTENWKKYDTYTKQNSDDLKKKRKKKQSNLEENSPLIAVGDYGWFDTRDD